MATLSLEPQTSSDDDVLAAESKSAILVVDDDPKNLLAIEAAFTDDDYVLVKAGSGEEALRRLLSQDFALILLDVQMPGMDGFETARIIRERARSRHVPIIFVTAHHQADADVLRGYGIGAVDFLFKPIVPEVLRAKAGVFVELRRQEERVRALERRAQEQRLLEERRSWEAEALREDNRRKDEFLAILAHELRNPLTPIVTTLELFKAKQLEDNTLRAARDAMERQVRHLVRLIDDLLDVSRISSGKISLRFEDVDLRTIIVRAVETSRPAIDERRHALTVVDPEGPIPVRGDGVRLTQVLSNLLNNAARYTEPEGNIELTAGVRGDTAFVRLRDDGVGIASEMLPRIFEPFVQESEGGRGLGLGLALVRRLVDLHGGTVHAESEGRGKGATFEVTLPLAGVTPALEGPETKAREQSGSHPASSLSVVVIDDDEDIRLTTTALLERWGFRVQSSGDGRRGVDLVIESQPDVVLVDIGMPHFDGFQVAQALLKRLADEGRPRLFALTGYGTATDRARVERAGFDGHLVKPVAPAVLLRTLRALDGAPDA